MSKLTIILVSLILLSCVEKDNSYWIKPENQNGLLVGFYASEEYCDLLKKSCSEFEELKTLDSLTLEKWELRNQDTTFYAADSLTSNILQDLEITYHEMTESCGGYCSDLESPILPYRTAELKGYWTDENFDKLSSRINKHISNLEEFYTIKVESTERYQTNELRKTFSSINLVEAMIELKRIQLEMIKLNERLKSR